MRHAAGARRGGGPGRGAAGLAGLLAALAWLPAACGGPSDDPSGDPADELTVLAAASLADTFRVLADRFEDRHDGVRVRLAFDSSATLATQVTEGAPADVLATADLETMQRVLDAGAASEATTFAANRMVLVTPSAGSARVRALADLEASAVALVTCVPTAPCGRVAAALLETNGVSARPRSLEVDVRAVLAKVVADEADAGLVYATDAQAAGGTVRTIAVPGSAGVPNRYAAAVLAQSRRPRLGRAWVELLVSAEGRRVLVEAGFATDGAASR